MEAVRGWVWIFSGIAHGCIIELKLIRILTDSAADQKI